MATHRLMSARIEPRATDDDVARLRVPPHSREAEQSVLGASLTDNAAHAVARAIIGTDDFYSSVHRLIWNAIGDLIDDGTEADVITVFERLQANARADDCGGLEFLNALALSVPGTSGVRAWATIVRERAILRRLIAVTDEIATAAFNPQGRPIAELLAVSAEQLRKVAAQAEAGVAEFPMLSMDELDAMPEQDWLVHGVIPRNAVGCIFGGSGSYKSFLMLDAGLRVAYGMPWLGRETEQGDVLVIVAEGATGTKKRVKAWRKAHGKESTKAPFVVLPVAVDILADASRVADAASAAHIKPALVIVDTLSQTFTGEENAANEMAAYLRTLGSAFRARWGCAVAVVHHTGHQFERPRGSSAIKANTDFLFGVFRDKDEGVAVMFNDKMKEEQDGEEFCFKLDRLDLGTDAKGLPVTSLVAQHVRTADELREVVAEQAKHGRKGYHVKLIELAREGQKEKDLRSAFYEACESLGSADSKSKAYRRAMALATNSGLLGVVNGEIRIFSRL